MKTPTNLTPYMMNDLYKYYKTIEIIEHKTVDVDTCDQLTNDYEPAFFSFQYGHIDTPLWHNELYTVKLDGKDCYLVQTPDPKHYWQSQLSVYEKQKDHSYCLSLDELNAWIDSPSW